MANERREGYIELHSILQDMKTELKEDIKAIDDKVEKIEPKIKDIVDTNNKLFHNGFPPHEHVADHHLLKGIVAEINNAKKDSKDMTRTIIIEVLKVAAVAAATWIAVVLWNGFKAEVQAPFDNKPRIEQNVKNSG